MQPPGSPPRGCPSGRLRPRQRAATPPSTNILCRELLRARPPTPLSPPATRASRRRAAGTTLRTRRPPAATTWIRTTTRTLSTWRPPTTGVESLQPLPWLLQRQLQASRTTDTAFATTALRSQSPQRRTLLLVSLFTFYTN